MIKRTLSAAASLLFCYVMSTVAASAHPLGNFTINHLSRIWVDSDELRVRYVADIAELPSVPIVRDASKEPNGLQLWARDTARATTSQLHVRSADRDLSLRLLSATATTVPGAGNLPTVRLVATFAAALPGAGGRLAYDDTTFAGRLGWKDVVVGSEVEPTNELRAYPSDLIGSPRNTTSIVARLSKGSIVKIASVESAGSGSVVAAPAIAAAPTAALGRSNALADMLARNDATPIYFLLMFVTAMSLGALHALEPGHGKTLMAVSLVGARATVQQAVILASAVTITHTIGVIAFGVVLLFATKYIVPEAIYPWITLASGLLVAFIGARALVRSVAAQSRFRHAHVHAHAQAHPHAHPHDHSELASDHHHTVATIAPEPHSHGTHSHSHGAHSHPHGAPHAHSHGAAHAHSHDGLDDEAHARAHAIPGNAPLSFRDVVIAAGTGGIAPCPAALVVLMSAIAVHKIGLGLALIVVFSAGLALVLTGIGIAVVRSATWLGERKGFERAARFGPFISAGTIALIGAVLVGEGFVQIGVAVPALLVTALALLAILGFAGAQTMHRHPVIENV